MAVRDFVEKIKPVVEVGCSVVSLDAKEEIVAPDTVIANKFAILTCLISRGKRKALLSASDSVAETPMRDLVNADTSTLRSRAKVRSKVFQLSVSVSKPPTKPHGRLEVAFPALPSGLTDLSLSI